MTPTWADLANIAIIMVIWTAGICVGWYLRGSKNEIR